MSEMVWEKVKEVALPSPFTSVRELGEPLRVHELEGLNKWTRLFFSSASMALALSIFLYGLAIYSRQFPPPPRQYLAIPIVFAILLFFGAFLWFRRVRMRWREAVVLYSDGLAYYDGRKILVFRWEDVAAIFTRGSRDAPSRFLPREGRGVYTIVHQNGKVLKLGNRLQSVDKLYEDIRHQVYKPILTRCCTAYDSGETILFGPLKMSRSLGLITADKNYLWDEIGQVVIEQGRLHIKAKGSGWSTNYSAPLRLVPNLDVFLAMANELAGLFGQSSAAG
jgi:hypothetical protein